MKEDVTVIVTASERGKVDGTEQVNRIPWRNSQKCVTCLEELIHIDY